MVWVSARPPSDGTAVPVACVAAGAGEAGPGLAVGKLAFLGACRYPAAYPAASPMSSPAASRSAAPRGGRQFSEGNSRPRCSTTSAAESSTRGGDPGSFCWLQSPFTWPGYA